MLGGVPISEFIRLAGSMHLHRCASKEPKDPWEEAVVVVVNIEIGHV